MGLLSFRYHSERRYLLGVLFWMKTFFSDWSYLIRNHLSFCFCDLFSKIYLKMKFTAKNWSDLCSFYIKVFFWHFCTRQYLFTFLCWIWMTSVSQYYYENLKKNEPVELVEKLPPSYLPYRFLHKLHSFLIKVKLSDLKKKNVTRTKLFVHR